MANFSINNRTKISGYCVRHNDIIKNKKDKDKISHLTDIVNNITDKREFLELCKYLVRGLRDRYSDNQKDIRYLTSLIVLNSSHNQIQQIDPGTFVISPQHRLNQVDLSSNQRNIQYLTDIFNINIFNNFTNKNITRQHGEIIINTDNIIPGSMELLFIIDNIQPLNM